MGAVELVAWGLLVVASTLSAPACRWIEARRRGGAR